MEPSFDDIAEARGYYDLIDNLTDILCTLEKQIYEAEKFLNGKLFELNIPNSSNYKLTLLKLAKVDEESRRVMDDWNYLKCEKEINTLRLEKMREKLNLKKKEMGIIPR